MEMVSLLLTHNCNVFVSANTFNGPIYVGVRGRLNCIVPHNDELEFLWAVKNIYIYICVTEEWMLSLAILHCNSWAKYVVGFRSLQGEKYCPGSAPKTRSAAEHHKSSFIVFLSDCKINGRSSTQFFVSFLVAR